MVVATHWKLSEWQVATGPSAGPPGREVLGPKGYFGRYPLRVLLSLHRSVVEGGEI